MNAVLDLFRKGYEPSGTKQLIISGLLIPADDILINSSVQVGPVSR